MLPHFLLDISSTSGAKYKKYTPHGNPLKLSLSVRPHLYSNLMAVRTLLIVQGRKGEKWMERSVNVLRTWRQRVRADASPITWKQG